jgi:hypothetical protein
MKSLKELKEAIANERQLFWCDPQPIEDNDYLITSINLPNDVTEMEIEDYPITIQYGSGSEAEVFISELKLVLTIQEYADKIGYLGLNPTLEAIQRYAENELDFTIWDYPLSEYSYVMEEVKDFERDEVEIVEFGGHFRVCEI